MAARRSMTTRSGSGWRRLERSESEFGADGSAVRSEVAAEAAVVNSVETHDVGHLGRQRRTGIGAEIAFPHTGNELRRVGRRVADLQHAEVLRQVVDKPPVH